MVFNSTMNTAKELCAWAVASIDGLTMLPQYRSHAAVYRDISSVCGLSASLIQQFYDGRRRNVTAETLDKLIEGIKAVKHLQAA